MIDHNTIPSGDETYIFTGMHGMTMIRKAIDIEPWVQRVNSLFGLVLSLNESLHGKALKKGLNEDNDDKVNIAKVALILKEGRWD